MIECVVLNLKDRYIDDGVSDMLRSPPSPVDKNITDVVLFCVVHDLLELLSRLLNLHRIHLTAR